MILFLVKLVFSGLALWWGIHQIDFVHLSTILKEMPPHIYGSAFLLMCCSISINGLRLYFIAKSLTLKESFKALHQITWIGMFFNQLLPGGIGGDAYRIYSLTKGGNGLLGTSAIFWDRALGIICMGLLSMPTLLTIKFPYLIQLLATVIYNILFGGLMMLAIFVRYPLFQKYKLMQNLWKIFASAKNIIRSPATLIATIVQAVVNFCVFYLLIIALNVPLNFAQSSILFTMSLFVVIIPISISGWGLREGFFTASFKALGLPPEMGFTLGLLQGLLMLSTGAVGAIFYIFSKKIKNSLANSSKKDMINTSKAGVAQG